MEMKAEAYAKYNNAAVIEMMVNIMPQMAAEIAKPLSAIDKVNIYGGWRRLRRYRPGIRQRRYRDAAGV